MADMNLVKHKVTRCGIPANLLFRDISICDMTMQKRWDKILRSNLAPDPAKFSDDKLYQREHRNDFFTPANLVVTIRTKHKHYTFGGKIYVAQFSLRDDKIHIVFPTPMHRKRPEYFISWDKITGIDLQFLP